MASILTQIVQRKIPAQFLHEDDLCAAILDIHPQAPTHVLVFPKKEIVSIASATPEDQTILGHLLLVAGQMARQLGLAESGYRLVTNIGADGGQSIPHLHIHLLGGRKLEWPPG